MRALLGAPPRAKKVIMCHGVFDVVHPGHVRHLLYAKSKADMLVASLTADEHITKGNYRPHVPQDLRAFNLAAFEMVDYVVIDENATPIENIRHDPAGLFRQGLSSTPRAERCTEDRQEELERRRKPTAARLHLHAGRHRLFVDRNLIEIAPPDR